MLEIKNYTLFNKYESGKKYETVFNEKGEEIGIRMKGLVTSFDIKNENGQVFKANSYDNFVKDYFIKNSVNVPIDIMHVRNDVRHLAGVAEKIEVEKNGIILQSFIPKGVYYYNLIKILIDNGILQGFSNYGYARDYELKENGFEIRDFALLSISLVDVPADTGAVFLQNTIFKGFGSNPDKSGFVTQNQTGELKSKKNNPLKYFY